jgi:hypothetical protein
MPNQDLFTIKPLNQWIAEASERPDPRSLFGDFWLEGELAILFSDAGRGKSLLGVQIADSIARGKPIAPVPMTARPRKVLYFDFEFSAKQFEMRYSADESPKDSYRFPKNFHRAEPAEGSPRNVRGVRLQPGGGSLIEREARKLQSAIPNPKSEIGTAASADGAGRKPAELASIEQTIRSSRAKVVVIDSMAWLQGPNITARHTVPLMRELKRLQSTLGLSILVLAHNPRRDTSRPLSISGLHGAGVMCNFADSVFALGQSRIDAGFRYIKHIKSRGAELTCDENNVLVGEIRKWQKNFLGFRFHRYSPESDHLVRELNPMIEDRANMIKEMSEDKGMTQRDIAAKLGISLGSVNRYLQMTREDQDYYDLDDGFDLDDDEPAEPDPVSSPRASKGAEPDPVSSPRASEGAEPGPVSSPRASKGAEPGPVSSPRVSKGAEPGPVSSPRVSKGAEPGPVSSPRVSKGAELNELPKLPKLPELVYKTLDDKIEVGDIVRDNDGRLMKKTNWGWDRCGL